MDFEQLIFPFVMAVVTNSIMIIIVYFLRKVPAFVNLFGVSLVAALYLFCLMRILVPIEIPYIQIVVEDKAVYTSVFDVLIRRDASGIAHPNTALFIICGIWAAGTVIIGAWSLILHKRFIRYLMANGDYATDRERRIFSEVVKENFKSDRRISLRKTDVISGTMIVGLIRKTVLIPDDTYTDDELRMMFLHECVHIKNKDLWIKLLVQIYCCLFWWNPFAYLLKSDLDATLEMKCDLNATKGFSDVEKLAYVETLKNRCIADSRRKTPFVVSAEFADGRRKTKLLERVKAILSNPPKMPVQIIANSLAILLIMSVFVASYIFIWQPSYQPTDEKYELADGGEIIDETNGYVLKHEDGTYEFFVTDFPPIPVTQEEIKQGMYEGYPIYEE